VRVAVACPDDWEDRVRALLPVMRPEQCFSHTTAARVLGLPLPRRFGDDAPIHVTTPGVTSGMRRRGVIGHVTGHAEVTVHRGLRVTTPVSTWLALGTMLSVVELTVVGDVLVGDSMAVAEPVDLVEAAAGRGGARGVARLRAAAEQVVVGTESPKETELRLALPPRLRDRFAPNVRVFSGGRYLGRPDLVAPAAMVAIEYEGDHHRTDPAVFRQDIARRERFEDAGWRVVRATQHDLDSGRHEFVERVGRLLASRPRAERLAEEHRRDRLWAVRG
jgi:hypothetical protein